MPAMGGLELEQELRRRWPQLRVVFMSGYSEELTTAGGEHRALLVKPFTPTELFAFVAAEIGPRVAVAG
jgi:DNA-binding response OmpR family regulator